MGIRLNKYAVLNGELSFSGELDIVTLGNLPERHISAKLRLKEESGHSFVIPLKIKGSSEPQSNDFKPEADNRPCVVAFDSYGLNLSTLPAGKYEAGIVASTPNARSVTFCDQFIRQADKVEHFIIESDIVIIRFTDSSLIIQKMTIKETVTNNNILKIRNLSLHENVLAMEANLVVTPQVATTSKESQLKLYFHLSAEGNGRSRTYDIDISHDSTKSWQRFLTLGKRLRASKHSIHCSVRAPLNILDVDGYEIYVVAIEDGAVRSMHTGTKLTATLSGAGPKKTVSIVGACVSRDLFNSKLNAPWKENYAYGGCFYQMSLISLMSSRPNLDHRLFHDIPKASIGRTDADIKKEFLDEMIHARPDILLVDLRIDARFGVIRLGDSWITDNLWNIGSSSNYKMFANNYRVSFESDSDTFIDLFRSACISFRAFLDENLPNTTVILNSSKSVSLMRSLEEISLYSEAQATKQNEAWSALEDVFVSVLEPMEIENRLTGIASDLNHPWGKGPVHYEPLFYKNANDSLNSIVNHNNIDYSLSVSSFKLSI